MVFRLPIRVINRQPEMKHRRITLFRLPIHPAPLFNILHLLAHLLNQHFQLHRNLRAFAGDGFAAQRIGFAVQFLHQEVQPLADACRAAR